MERVGLVMIVRDEEAVIRRALESARPWISTWVICDTGSTDRTKDIIREVMADVSGLLVDRPWVSFEHNRTEALELCRDRMDWALMLDADDNLAGAVPPAEIWSHTELDGFVMRIKHDQLLHQRVQIFRVASNWIYVGKLHEYAKCIGKESPALAVLPADTYMETRCEGVRSRDPHKYLKDALLLEKELLENPNDSRILFYLAQSYRDAKRPLEAQIYYQRYLDLSGTWIQERYNVLINMITLVADPARQIAFTWQAIDLLPQRLEAQYTLLNRWRKDGRAPTQQIYAIGACATNRKPDMMNLFINPAVYEFAFDDEFTIVAFQTGHIQEAYDAAMRTALNAPTQEMRENSLDNARKLVPLLNKQ